MTTSLFSVVGINHNSADVQIRNQFALNSRAQQTIFTLLKKNGKDGILILSTCNRTEIYGCNVSPYVLIDCWKKAIHDPKIFNGKHVYQYNDGEAIQHLFRVTSGIESQIPGDYDVVHQVKQAFTNSQKQRIENGLLEKIVNTAIRVSKRVKTETEFSSGTSSVSFAVSKYFKNAEFQRNPKDVLVIGMGKMGKAITKHLANVIPKNNIYISNRTLEKSRDMQTELGVNVLEFEMLKGIMHFFSHIIIAAEIPTRIIEPTLIKKDKSYRIFDLTLPTNLNHDFHELENVEIVEIDAISKMIDDNISQRKAELPKVFGIIENELLSFAHWLHIQKMIKMNRSLDKNDFNQIRNLKMDPFDLISMDNTESNPINETLKKARNFLKPAFNIK